MKLKKILPYIIVFFISFFATPAIIRSFAKKANQQAKEYVENFEPKTSQLPNGFYVGKFKAFRLITMSKVEFTVQNGEIKNIEFKKMFHSPGSPYKESIENQIKQSKQLEINAITGATRSSNFAKAAIKHAIHHTKLKDAPASQK
jgi:uncharacterized protein with FMN-binding domain